MHAILLAWRFCINVFVIVAVYCLSGASAIAHIDLVLVNFGGSAARVQMLALLQPWQEKNNKIAEMEEYAGGLDEIRRQVEAANVKWDVVDMEYSDLIQACEERLLEKIDPAMLPAGGDATSAVDDFLPFALHDCGVGNIIWSNVYAYSDSAFPCAKPSTIVVFLIRSNFPGNAAFAKTLEPLLNGL